MAVNLKTPSTRFTGMMSEGIQTSATEQCIKLPLFGIVLACSLVLGACSDSTSPGDSSTDSTNTGIDNGNTNPDPGPGSDPEPTPEPQPQPLTLAPLPDPPLTPAPSADDDPLSESSEFNTATSLTVLREPGTRLPEEVPPLVTEADFAAGPLPPTFQIPADVDPATNAAPFFENLQDQQLFAGEVLQVLFKPIDPDGGVPGMFPEELPEGAQFIDNFDGSKSLLWQPLQMDIGIREFTVTAIDPLNSQYRTIRTIRIKIEEPADLATIPNVAPRLEDVLPHTVRVNDAVILELKGLDLNGTVPQLEIPQLPDGGTLNQHPRFEEIYVLKFTPTEVGTTSIEVIARDAVDASLTTSTTIDLQIMAAGDFSRGGERLRQLADNRGIMIGYASRHEFFHRPDSGLYTEIAAQEFNLVTSENSMKMDYMNPLPGRYQFAETENLIAFASQNNMQVHAHPLVWYTQLPQWIKESEIDQRQGHMQEYIHRIMSRYDSRVALWDVVNEPLEDNGSLRNSVWFEAMGEDYIDIAFRQARATAPTATLLLNEYDIAAAGAKSDAFFALLDRLIAKGTPIDGIGFQMHLWSDFNQFDAVRANFQKAADRGFDVYVTELDVAISAGGTDETQAAVYRQVMDLCLEQTRCRALQTWGFTDQYSWRRNFSPLIFDTGYQPKPAYSALQEALTAP